MFLSLIYVNLCTKYCPRISSGIKYNNATSGLRIEVTYTILLVMNYRSTYFHQQQRPLTNLCWTQAFPEKRGFTSKCYYVLYIRPVFLTLTHIYLLCDVKQTKITTFEIITIESKQIFNRSSSAWSYSHNSTGSHSCRRYSINCWIILAFTLHLQNNNSCTFLILPMLLC